MTGELGNPTSALLAGALAGTVVDFSLYPIDTIKTRLQASSGFRQSGGFQGVYRGVGSALVGSAPGAALFFISYESIKASFQERRNAAISARPDAWGSWSEPVEHMVAASVGEVAACAIRVPTEVVKQRAQAFQSPTSLAAVRSIWALRKPHGERGSMGLLAVWREMYRGWGITVFREVPFTVIQFPLWEVMKERRRRTQGRDSISAWESGLFGSIAGAVAAGVTTPLDVLKTRMMLAKERQATMPLVVSIWSESGPRAFFAGIGPRVLWISAGGAIFLGSYQWAYNALQNTPR
ncbi:MAG: S-adenosylmethionine transporter [Heterodermia speciosa]|uniref:S-adenosylmethionine transporter n=1 Tax=Heterodermia speciosa TaxID=116794 RepID=A0A8H3IG18_9LECA|nr:MAG: S-adenosylmethionine transporter [Heterodermia speciosa]